MTTEARTRRFMIAVIAVGLICLATASITLPVDRFDLRLLLIVAFTIGLGSRFTIPIPQIKSHISVSDTFIFLTFLLYGGEIAVVLAAVEAYFASWRFCSKRITIFFNAATMAISTAAVVGALQVAGLRSEDQLHGHTGHFTDFVVAISVIALTQFIVNTTLACLHDSLKNSLPFAETWKNRYLWSFVTYFIGAASAGGLVQLYDWVGFGMILAIFPVIAFVFLTYRMYLNNLEMSVSQTEQAEQYARTLETQAVALQESEERFRSAFSYAPIGIALVSPDGRWLKVNRALCDILGTSESELLEKEFQSAIHVEDLGSTLVRIHEVVSSRAASCQMENRWVSRSGKTVWASWSVSAASDSRSAGCDLIFQVQDITGKKLAEARLQHDATHDALTGLANRTLFMGRLDETLSMKRSDAGHRVSVLFIDLDRFKNVNDSLGHLYGDRLLIGISERLRDCMRPTDTVARFGGDEFVVLVEGEHDVCEVIRIADRIQEKFGVCFDLRGHQVYTSASIGILHASEKHLTSEDMMRDADTAMYQAKRAGKARHEVFDENMHTAAKETLRIETDLRKAIESDDISVCYQPILSLDTGEMIGLEALARWQHPELGVISPKRFIGLAEEIGVINILGERVMTRACRDVGSFFGELPPEMTPKLSINLSCRQFASADLVERIERILGETGFSPSRLKLEITESVFFEYQERAVGMLNRLREIGIELDVDDFGTGYSNLGYLVQLPISTLKIDRSFVTPINEAGANTEIVRTILAMARNLGLGVVAEGIESEYQIQALKDLGCDRGQGYFLAEPMDIAGIREFALGETRPNVIRNTANDVSIVSTLQ